MTASNVKELYGREGAHVIVGWNRSLVDGEWVSEPLSQPRCFSDLGTLGKRDDLEAIDPKEIWYAPDLLSYGDYCPSGLVSASNAASFMGYANECDPQGEKIRDISATYGGGVVIRGDVDDEEVIRLLCSLDDYLLLDEHEYADMENDARIEAWEDWAARDFLSSLERKLEFESCEMSEEKDEALYELFNLTSTEWVNEQGDSMWTDVDDAAAKVCKMWFSNEKVRQLVELLVDSWDNDDD